MAKNNEANNATNNAANNAAANAIPEANNQERKEETSGSVDTNAAENNTNPAPKPEDIPEPPLGLWGRFRRFLKSNTRAAKVVKAGIAVGTLAGVGTATYAFGHLRGRNEGMLDALASMPSDDGQLAIEDKSSTEDIDVDVSDVGDIEVIDI